ncbi:MAG: PIN domain nuclease of toxin-antitoxin system [Myxococcota bacterium]|jgi:PIN domain nuclease of toxin-antitoxin system
MSAVVLDTHVWLWWLSDPERLSGPARAAVQAAVSDDAVHLSTISSWEVAMLVQRGRLELDRDAEAFVRATEALPFVHFVPVSNAIALRSIRQEEPAH